MGELLVDGKLNSELFYVEIKQATTSELIYSSRKGSGNSKFAFWKVKNSPNFYSLGHLFTDYYEINQRQGKPYPSTITISPKSDDLLKLPDDYELIWDDRGTKNPDSAFVWRMIPPAGYVAMGCVVTTTKEKPTNHEVRCIKKSAVQGADFNFKNTDDKVGPTWIDKGSRATGYLAIYLSKLNSNTKPDKGKVHLVTGTFLASDDYSSLPAENPYCLVLNFPSKDVLGLVTIDRPKLKGPYRPSEEELESFTHIEAYELPFFAVNDSYYKNQLDQFLESPIYKLKRITSYKVIDSYQPINKETKTFTITSGLSDESNHSTTVGGSIGVTVGAEIEAGVPLVANGKIKTEVTVEAHIDHSWGGATTEYKETSHSFPQTIDAGCFGVLFQMKSCYELYRKNDTKVSGQVEIAHDDYYATQWKPENAVEESSDKTITFKIKAPKGKIIILEGKLEIRDGEVTSLPNILTQNLENKN